MRRFCLAALLLLCSVIAASAQDSTQDDKKNEIAGTIGHTFISNQGVLNSGLSNSVLTFGPGFSFEVNYARVLLAHDWADFAVEVPAVFNPDEDLHYQTNQIPEGYSSFFVTPAARLRFFPDVAISPWVSFGGGLGYFDSSSNLLFSGSNAGNRTVTTGVLQGGVGLDVSLPCHCLDRLRIRVEARDDWSGVPSLNVDTGKTRQHNYYVGGGLVYRF